MVTVNKQFSLKKNMYGSHCLWSLKSIWWIHNALPMDFGPFIFIKDVKVFKYNLSYHLTARRRKKKTPNKW